jgi:branched-chain amino acid transport system substrate-binding protein
MLDRSLNAIASTIERLQMFDSFSRRNRSLKILTASLGVGLVAGSVLAGSGANAAPAPKPAPKSPTAACPAVNGVTPTSITLGMIYPKTGSAATTFAGMEQAVRLRLDQENAKGGVFGRKLLLVPADDQNSPTTAISVTNKLLDETKVFGIIWGSSTVSQFPLLKERNIPVVGLSNGTAFGYDRNAFGATGSSAPEWSNNVGVLRLKQAGASVLGYISQGTSGGINAGNQWGALVASVPGTSTILKITDLPLTSYDATSTALRVKSSGVQGLSTIFSPAGIISVLQAFKQQGVNIPALWPGLTDPGIVAQVGAAGEGQIGVGYGTTPVNLTKIPAVRTFVNGMKAAGANPYASIAPNGYISADIWIKGLKLAGACPTNQSFIDKLRTVSSYDAAGMLPSKIQFTPGVVPNGSPQKCSWYLTVKSGQLVPDAKPTCGSLVNTVTGEVR